VQLSSRFPKHRILKILREPSPSASSSACLTPTQIVDFDFSSTIDPAQSYLLNAAGAEVPFQQLSNKHIAVSTDLPANASRSWTLYSGRPPASFPNPVTLNANASYYEIGNGLTGVRITRPTRPAA